MKQNEKEGILLESGTNEIEVMKFTVMGEVLWLSMWQSTGDYYERQGKAYAHANPSVEGIFKPGRI